MATQEPASEEKNGDVVGGGVEPAADPEQAPVRRWLLFTSAAWLRALREIAIVTLGILIAFALNAWWEEHRERRQEQQHLRALASDFRENIEQLARLATTEDRISQSSLKLLEAARAPEAPSAEKIRSLIGEVFNSQRFEPVMGAYEALVNSAGLTLVRDDVLRASLAVIRRLRARRHTRLSRRSTRRSGARRRISIRPRSDHHALFVMRWRPYKTWISAGSMRQIWNSPQTGGIGRYLLSRVRRLLLGQIRPTLSCVQIPICSVPLPTPATAPFGP